MVLLLLRTFHSNSGNNCKTYLSPLWPKKEFWSIKFVLDWKPFKISKKGIINRYYMFIVIIKFHSFPKNIGRECFWTFYVQSLLSAFFFFPLWWFVLLNRFSIFSKRSKVWMKIVFYFSSSLRSKKNKK